MTQIPTGPVAELHADLGRAEASLAGVPDGSVRDRLRRELIELQNKAQQPYVQDAGPFSGVETSPEVHRANVDALRGLVAALTDSISDAAGAKPKRRSREA